MGRRIRRVKPQTVDALDDVMLGALVRVKSYCDDTGKVWQHDLPPQTAKSLRPLELAGFLHTYRVDGKGTVVHVNGFAEEQKINRPASLESSEFPRCDCEKKIIFRKKGFEWKFSESVNHGITESGWPEEKLGDFARGTQKKCKKGAGGDPATAPAEWKLLFHEYDWTPSAAPLLRVALNLELGQVRRLKWLMLRSGPELWIAHALEVDAWSEANGENRRGPMMGARLNGTSRVHTPADDVLKEAKRIYGLMNRPVVKSPRTAKHVGGVVQNLLKEQQKEGA